MKRITKNMNPKQNVEMLRKMKSVKPWFTLFSNCISYPFNLVFFEVKCHKVHFVSNMDILVASLSSWLTCLVFHKFKGSRFQSFKNKLQFGNISPWGLFPISIFNRILSLKYRQLVFMYHKIHKMNYSP